MSDYRFKLFQIVLIAGLIFGISACDSNFVPDNNGSNPNVTDPDNTVASNVGPVEKLVTEDVLALTNNIRDNILNFLDDVSGDDTFDGGQELLTFRFVGETDTEQSPLSGTIDLSQDLPCDFGGSKDVVGSATFTLNGDRITGSILGSFTIQYDNCQDVAVMITSTGNCAVTPTVAGDLRNIVDLDYTLDSTDIQGQEVIDTTDVSSFSTIALAVTVGNTPSDQSYNFDYSLSSNSTNTNLDGTVSFQSKLYDLIELENFVANSTTSAVCP